MAHARNASAVASSRQELRMLCSGVLVLRAVAWYIAALTQMRLVDAQRFLTTPFSALAARERVDESSVDTSLDGYQTTSRLR